MRQRCYNPKNRDFKHYGGRGITVCEEWRKDFKVFHDWAMANGYAKGLTLDRIDVNGNYSPENCRWATMLEQSNNLRKNKLLTYQGETKTVAEWARIKGIRRNTLWLRLYKHKWSVEKALTTPLRKRGTPCDT